MIAVTGATGHLGTLAIDELLKRNVEAKDIVALVRDKAKAQKLAAKGINLRVVNYNAPETLQTAFEGVSKVLFISGSEVGQRVAQHTAIINAAKKAGVKLLAYTSILKADSSQMILAKEHLQTENLIKDSGIAYVILRNGWYIENYSEQFGTVLQSGVIAGSAKNGRVSAATRADYAAAAVAAVMGEAKLNSIYELGGKAFTLAELAKEVAQASGKNIEYKDMPAADYEKMLTGFGVPAGFAHVLADSDVGLERGDLFTESRDLENLIHRPPTALNIAVKSAVSRI